MEKKLLKSKLLFLPNDPCHSQEKNLTVHPGFLGVLWKTRNVVSLLEGLHCLNAPAPDCWVTTDLLIGLMSGLAMPGLVWRGLLGLIKIPGDWKLWMTPAGLRVELIPSRASRTKPGKESRGIRMQLMAAGEGSLQPGLLEVRKAGASWWKGRDLDGWCPHRMCSAEGRIKMGIALSPMWIWAKPHHWEPWMGMFCL